jgi:hypothetical protein
MWTIVGNRAKGAIAGYFSLVCPLYKSYPYAGPFPNLPFHPAVGETVSHGVLLPALRTFFGVRSRFLCNLTFVGRMS